MGSKTRTKIVIVYVQDLANPELVKAVKTRIKAISSDMALPPGFIQEFKEDNSYSLPSIAHGTTGSCDRQSNGGTDYDFG
ncbi:spore germination protein [Paenibacillus alvei]|uniref:spore germination protein n=1 Tax=Paenibacillus alvei TaxID=44250 RepID=UPI003D302718